MLTNEEMQFISYWEKNRNKKKKFWKQLAIGLPAGVLFAAAIFINMFSGWYKRATMVFNSDASLGSLVMVLIIAVLLIVIFVSVFSEKVKWERNEQNYLELLNKKDKLEN